MKVAREHRISPIAKGTDDAANDLLGLYVHDDRLGPYLRAGFATKEVQLLNPGTGRLEQKARLQLVMSVRLLDASSDSLQAWELTHILIPMHGKIRLSFGGLRDVAIETAAIALGYKKFFLVSDGEIPDPTVMLDTWIVRAHKYVEDLFLEETKTTADLVFEISTQVPLARYVGVVRISSQYFDPIDIIVDTTSTQKNIHCLAIVVPNAIRPHTKLMANYLANALRLKIVPASFDLNPDTPAPLPTEDDR
jgi:hypothetical protein